MDYEYYQQNMPRPRSNKSNFVASCSKYFDLFLDNTFLQKIQDKSLRINDFHKLLNNLFYQVYFSSSSFALAAAKCEWDQKILRDYLIKHAEEEKTHWCWILDDLKSTGFDGDPRSKHPPTKAVAYFSYAHFLANKNPLLRLSMAYFLEGLSAKFGQEYGARVCDVLKIKSNQLSFFMQHGHLDAGHSTEVLSVIESYSVSEELWGEMEHVLMCTCEMYRDLYNI